MCIRIMFYAKFCLASLWKIRNQREPIQNYRLSEIHRSQTFTERLRTDRNQSVLFVKKLYFSSFTRFLLTYTHLPIELKNKQFSLTIVLMCSKYIVLYVVSILFSWMKAASRHDTIIPLLGIHVSVIGQLYNM